MNHRRPSKSPIFKLIFFLLPRYGKSGGGRKLKLNHFAFKEAQASSSHFASQSSFFFSGALAAFAAALGFSSAAAPEESCPKSIKSPSSLWALFFAALALGDFFLAPPPFQESSSSPFQPQSSESFRGGGGTCLLGALKKEKQGQTLFKDLRNWQGFRKEQTLFKRPAELARS